MKHLVVIGLVVVAAALFAIVHIWDSTTDNQAREEAAETAFEETDDLSADIRTDSITEFIVDFGEVRYGDTATRTIRLRNSIDKPLTLTEYQATCRCTWMELPRYPITSGEWAEAEIFFDSRGEYGTVGNYIEITTSDERCRVAVWMCAEIIN